MAKLTEKELEYQRRWREKRNADPELLRRHREYQRQYQKEWAARPENRAKSRKASLAYYYRDRAANCEASHWRNVKRRYGITQEQYQQIVALQGGGCALCGSQQRLGEKRFSVDHCHRSTVVRGILCEPCNVLLGRVDMNPAWLQKAIDYLANPPAAKVVNATCAQVERSNLKRTKGWR